MRRRLDPDAYATYRQFALANRLHQSLISSRTFVPDPSRDSH
jgi:hypothetical protein